MKRELKNDNAGMTLAELIVTFALMGIFLAAVATVISSSVVVQSELTGTMYAESVGETLLDKITGEIAAAKVSEGKAIVVGKVLKGENDLGEGVSFYDRNGQKSCFLVEDGLLVMKADSDWKMDAGAYMGYRITDFRVNRLNDKNVFEVIIKIKNLKTGFEYTASRAVQSYNFRTQQDYDKIVEEDIVIASE
ncbi:MAG: prepilin-type N-terminal cleavage/methylation domain-containing protein [Eubacterium sp.]|nr:prepilin-type N-terminal cleavage/methylation domain-containing protein [Lachnospiraceae bacterium]MBO5487930.1 prepilin-type N-terminal cleavage/methylation domain-containing protein [Eubacterium sp.]